MKHSPGPWAWDKESHSSNVLRASNGVSVAMLDARVTQERCDSYAGDRELLPLLPDMREMLLKMAEKWDGNCPECGEKFHRHASDVCELGSLLERLR